MTSRSRHTMKLHAARDVIARRGERITELERALRQLQDLHDVSKLLTSFDTVERTVPAVMSVVARSLALRNAIVLLGTTATPLTIVWQAGGTGTRDLQAATAHATTMYEYLLRARGTAPDKRGSDRTFVMLPLVVDQSIFGALQVEGVAPLDERDLVFVNAVVNQLAIAIDRAAAITARRVAIESGESQQRLLADLGVTLVAATRSRDGYAALARAVVPRVADVCIIDEIGEDGAVDRGEVIVANEDLEVLAARLNGCPALPEVTEVLESGEPMVVSNIGERERNHGELANLLGAAGATSVVVVPVCARGRKLGAMTLAAVGRHYSTSDLTFLREIADRAALGIESIQLHEQTQRTAEELRHAVQLREDLLAIVSHDLRNPLSAIDLSASALLEQHGDEPRSRKQLETVHRAIARMEHLINDLLDMASIHTGRLSLDRTRTDATKLVTEVLDDFEPRATEKQIELRRDLEVDGVQLRADRQRITQVFGNLLGNALKFCRAGDAVDVRMRVVDQAVQFVVEDTGPGIPETELPHIFEPYWSAKRHTGKGTGLGLYICKGIIEAHGGRLWVESTIGVGTKFFFTLPLGSS